MYPAYVSKNPAAEIDKTTFVLRINEFPHLFTLSAQ